MAAELKAALHLVHPSHHEGHLMEVSADFLLCFPLMMALLGHAPSAVAMVAAAVASHRWQVTGGELGH